MRIDIGTMEARFRAAQSGKASEHTAESRLHPSFFQYDYLALSTLADDVRELVTLVPGPADGATALDIGSSRSPYRSILENRRFLLETLDLDREGGANHAGAAEATGLADSSYDLVLCTQVLEHCDDPWQAAREIRRILRPGGHAIISAPHVWFFHPHPRDHWRFTQEGIVRLMRESGLEPMVLLAQGGSILTVVQVLNFLLYGVLGRWGGVVYALLNVSGQLLDRMLPNDLFCHNFACLVRRGEAPKDRTVNSGC